MQLSRCWRSKSKNGELMEVDIKRTNENLKAEMLLVSIQEQTSVNCRS